MIGSRVAHPCSEPATLAIVAGSAMVVNGDVEGEAVDGGGVEIGNSAVGHRDFSLPKPHVAPHNFAHSPRTNSSPDTVVQLD
jgi:hypothetical protein